ncbi:MAG: putative radical enzyme, family [Bacteroidetes bacterium]|nr:putative radical enzyme, family [Bacteroidota bacterium]
MKISLVEPGSIAEELGIQAGDELLEINGKRVLDAIDYRFHENGPDISLKVSHRNEVIIYDIEKDEDDRVGIDFEEMKILSCGNDCIFCFVDQNPKGLRNQLYFRDGDYRLSFMYGNYTTMTNAGPAILNRIIEQRLSPQYISVHVTDYEVRKLLMGLKKDDCILDKIKQLHDGGIDMHTQIVLCPEINDGKIFIEDLYQFNEHIISLAIVPVGLTDHRFGLFELKRVDHDYAERLLDLVEPLQEQLRGEIGRAFVYPSDEFYIVAGREIPPAGSYDGFPQTENGVGLVRSFLEDFKRQSKKFPPRLKRPRRMVMATATLPSRHMRDEVLPRLKRIGGLDVQLQVVPNLLYGESVTVAGLLSGKCLYSAMSKEDCGDMLLLPPDILNADGFFLDDATVPQLEDQLDVPIVVFDGSWSDVFSHLNNPKRIRHTPTLLPILNPQYQPT